LSFTIVMNISSDDLQNFNHDVAGNHFAGKHSFIDTIIFPNPIW
jgi:hypothetical protein